jgi:hypothetical protein
MMNELNEHCCSRPTRSIPPNEPPLTFCPHPMMRILPVRLEITDFFVSLFPVYMVNDVLPVAFRVSPLLILFALVALF